MAKKKSYNIVLAHYDKGHELHKATLNTRIGPGDKMGSEGRIATRVWVARDDIFFEFLQRQKNLKRMCPYCNPKAYQWEAKWNERTPLSQTLAGANLNL